MFALFLLNIFILFLRIFTLWADLPKPKMSNTQGTWVTQLVKHLTLGFSSGHDLWVLGWSPKSGTVLSMESVCPFTPFCPMHFHMELMKLVLLLYILVLLC